MHPKRILLCVLACLLAQGGSIGAAFAKRDNAAILVFARDGTDANLAVRIERDLRNMMLVLAAKDARYPNLKDIEKRFDVGNLSKGHLSRSRRQFNSAQRAFLKKDFEKAKGHLFRARRFYNRASPHAADPPLLRGIFYYDYLVYQASGDSKKASEAYCEYVALGRALAGNAGALEQFEPLSDKCGQSKAAGTGELRVTSNVDGAHVYVDNRPVGVIGRSAPYVNPFLPAGPHFLEVRKVGFVRWGKLASLTNGKSVSIRARLKKARSSIRSTDYDPLKAVVLDGKDRFSDEYLTDFLFRMADQYGVKSLIVGYLDAGRKDASKPLAKLSSLGLG